MLTSEGTRKAARSRLNVGAALLVLLVCSPAFAQGELPGQLAELMTLRDKVRDADTRTRVSAFHRAWTLALATENSDVKLQALELMKEPVGSASDHIRLPAVYAISDIANSTSDARVKLRALEVLREPMLASQLPIRSAAIDAVNTILGGGRQEDVQLAALQLLGEPVRSGNNGVRIPAINAILRAVEHSNNDRGYNQALDLLTAPLDTMAAIGGMEVRLMAVVAVERIGREASEAATKARAMGMMQLYANKASWEPEAKRRALDASARIRSSIQQREEQPKQQSNQTRG